MEVEGTTEGRDPGEGARIRVISRSAMEVRCADELCSSLTRDMWTRVDSERHGCREGDRLCGRASLETSSRGAGTLAESATVLLATSRSRNDVYFPFITLRGSTFSNDPTAFPISSGVWHRPNSSHRDTNTE